MPTNGAFTHGVASGDPHADSVVLWTRLQPSTSAGPVQITWSIGTDPELASPTSAVVAETGR